MLLPSSCILTLSVKLLLKLLDGIHSALSKFVLSIVCVYVCVCAADCDSGAGSVYVSEGENGIG